MSTPDIKTESASPSGDKANSRTPTSWDPEDDILLMHLKDNQKLGWKAIAANFTNRTPNACQFRWRRLKSGNLKNPPKSAAALGSTESFGKAKSTEPPVKKQKKYAFPNTKANGHVGTGFPSAYSPIPNSGFSNYDNNVTNALAGLNALSNDSSNISSPLPYNQSNQIQHSPEMNDDRDSNSNSNENSPIMNSPKVPPQTTNNYQHSPEDDDLNLDPSQQVTEGGGYYAEILVDPTMNLPHNQSHPLPSGLTPRNSSTGLPVPNDLNHNNSIIQIVRDEKNDRNSISSARDSISSLPSKSMNIPHHQLDKNALAHLPTIFGGNGSVSGPSRNSSISHNVLSSLRSASIVGSGYFSRSGSVIIPFNSDKDKEKELGFNPKNIKKNKNKIKDKKITKDKKKKDDKIELPWTMEEDELLINRRNRELSFAELSILLPQRTEGDIWNRIDYLEKLRNGVRSSVARERRRRQSSIGLDDVEDFYMSDIGVTEDDDDDEVLVDVDDIPQAHRRGLKRRTSSAVNPLSVNN